MSLEAVLGRLKWAEAYQAALDGEVHNLRQLYSDPPLSMETKGGGRVRDFSVGDVPEIPPDLGLLVGDCVHNFRASLDNLVYTIAEESNPGRFSSEERRASSFPITEARADFREARRRGALARLPPRAQARIQRMQPFRGRGRPELHPLAVLRRLSDMDKHRTVPVIAWSAPPFSLSPSVPGARWYPLSASLEPHKPFIRLTLPAEFARTEVNVVWWFSVFVQGPDSLRERAVDLWLHNIQHYLRDWVVPELARYCAAASHQALAEAYGVTEWPASLPRRFFR